MVDNPTEHDESSPKAQVKGENAEKVQKVEKVKKELPAFPIRPEMKTLDIKK